MFLKLMYITNSVDVALIAEKYGVDRIWIDLETLGKQERQGHIDSVKSKHSINDIKKISPKLTKSELFAVMVGGFGSASASILAGYALMGIDMRYLLIAVFTVPFSTLMVSKIMVPETEQSLTENAEVSGSESDSLFEAISEGTGNGLGLSIVKLICEHNNISVKITIQPQADNNQLFNVEMYFND